MIKFHIVKVVSEFLTSKCKDIVIAVLRAQVSFLSNPVNKKHHKNRAVIIAQVTIVLKKYTVFLILYF